MRTRKTASLLTLSITAILILMVPTAHARQFERSRAQIRYVMGFHHIPSVTVAVAHKGKIVWEESFGWADVAKRKPATPHTPYAIASTTKPMTATAIMILAQRGAIDLDKPIDDYLGVQKLTARVGSAKDATVRRVASHTAGLPLHGRYFYADESASSPTMDETIRRYGTLVTAPGEAFVYSNLDYGLFEHAIELVSGRSYAAFLRDEIFAPLGLDTGAVNPRPEAGREVATRYWVDGTELPFYDFDQLGGGAVVMSAHDLVRFGMFHLYGHVDGQKKTVLPQSALASMHEPVLLNDGSPAGYGFGWFVGEQHGLRWFGHNGGMAGVVSVLSVYPTAEAVIVVLANGVTVTGAVHFIERDILHDLLPETIRTDHGFKPPAELVGEWQGQVHTYRGEMPVELQFKENGSVFARVGAAPSQEVVSIKLDSKTSSLLLDDLIGTIDTPDATRHVGRLQFSLKLRDAGTLNGTLASNAMERLPDRLGDAVSHWVELHKKKQDP
jgi:CubicO group peptidase (beta-lactamase class C family)